MSAVFGAFLESMLTFIYFVIIAAAGIFAGKALLQKKKNKQLTDTDQTSKE